MDYFYTSITKHMRSRQTHTITTPNTSPYIFTGTPTSHTSSIRPHPQIKTLQQHYSISCLPHAPLLNEKSDHVLPTYYLTPHKSSHPHLPTLSFTCKHHSLPHHTSFSRHPSFRSFHGTSSDTPTSPHIPYTASSQYYAFTPHIPFGQAPSAQLLSYLPTRY